MGIDRWRRDAVFVMMRQVMSDILSKSNVKLDCWRVFIIQDPSRLCSPDIFPVFHRVLNENAYDVGAQTAVHIESALPDDFPPEYADCHCVIGVMAFASTTPRFALAPFSWQDSREMVRRYSQFVESLVENALNPNCPAAFVWKGGTPDVLEDRLYQMGAMGWPKSAPSTVEELPDSDH